MKGGYNHMAREMTPQRKQHKVSIDDLQDFEITQVLAADSGSHKSLWFHWQNPCHWFTVRHRGMEVLETRLLEVAIERYNNI
jgi:hypothetical protein